MKSIEVFIYSVNLSLRCENNAGRKLVPHYKPRGSPFMSWQLTLYQQYKIPLNSKTRKLAFAAIYVATYVSLVELFPFISYGQLNVRVADFLYGLIPFFPAEMLWAGPLATFISDLTSPFGFYDFIGSTCVIALSIAVCTKVQRRTILGGFIALTGLLGTWLSWLIWYVGTGGQVPFIVIAAWVFAGNIIGEIVLPYSFFKVLQARGFKRLEGR